MKKINFAIKLIGVTIVFYVCYNFYFGWNFKPLSENEMICDTIFTQLMKLAFVIYFMPLLEVYEQYIKDKNL